MATLAEVKKLINQYYKKARRRQAKVFKEMWGDIYNLLSNKPTTEKTTEKPKEKTVLRSDNSKDEKLNVDISEIVKEAIKEEQEERKPVSQSGEVFCKYCRQNVYPEEYNSTDNICYGCEKERLDE